jgi:hypothetical protein
MPAEAVQDYFERQYQLSVWGNEFDDTNSQNDWVSYITKYAGRGTADVQKTLYPDPQGFRSAMIKVATLAIAALEALDRHNSKGL